MFIRGQLGEWLGNSIDFSGAGEPAVVPALLDGMTGVTGAYSTYRGLFTDYVDSYYVETIGRVSAFKNQANPANDLNQASSGSQPIIAVISGKDWIQFDGVRQLVGGLMNTFIAVNDGFMVISCRPTQNDKTGSGVNGRQIIGDAAEGGNIVLRNDTGISSIQFDTAYRTTPGIFPAGLTAAPLVIAFRKDGTSLYCSLLGHPEESVICGNLGALAYAMYLGGGGTNKFIGSILELVTFNASPDSTERARIISNMMTAAGSPRTPSKSGFPTALTTGYSGTLTAATAGDVAITVAGVYENLDYTGTITVSVAGVTIRNCRIASSGNWAIRILDGITTIVEDCEINGQGTGNTTGIAGSGTFSRNNIYGCENGIVLTEADSIVQDNYIHDLVAAGSPHYDCIECNGGQDNTIIRRNALYAPSQTAAINVNNYFAGSDSLLIEDNLCVGGTYTIYVDGQFAGGLLTNVTVQNNVLEGGEYGLLNYNIATPTSTGNVDGIYGLPAG